MTPRGYRAVESRVKRRVLLVCALIFASTLGLSPVDVAAQTSLRVFTTRAIRTVLDSIGPEFERSSGRRLEVITDIAAPLVRRVRGGESFDVLIASPAQMDALANDGFVVSSTRIDLAQSGIGVAVRQGAAVPDVSSVSAFVQTLLNAGSIAYLSEGQSGVYLASLLDSLSISTAIQHQVARPVQDVVSQLVAQGDVQLGMVVVTQILTTPGVTLAGPLPDEIQNYIVFSGGISSQSPDPEGARDLLALLSRPSAQSVMRLQGMEPLGIARP